MNTKQFNSSEKEVNPKLQFQLKYEPQKCIINAK